MAVVEQELVKLGNHEGMWMTIPDLLLTAYRYNSDMKLVPVRGKDLYEDKVVIIHKKKWTLFMEDPPHDRFFVELVA